MKINNENKVKKSNKSLNNVLEDLTLKEVIFHLLFLVFILVAIYPIVFGLSNSFKTMKDAYHTILQLIPRNFTFENYKYLNESLPLLKIVTNTFLIATVTTIVKLTLAFLASFALVFFVFPGKKALYIAFIGTIFVPFTVTMIPNYLNIAKIGLMDSIWGVMLPQFADAVGIFILVQTMRSIPKSLIEVAKLDNLKDWAIMRGIVFPMCRHAIASTGIWFFITTWNEYVWPVLILKSVENYTLPLALQNFISSEGGTNFTVAMSVSVITMAIPLILYVIFQKYIIGTFVSSGIK